MWIDSTLTLGRALVKEQQELHLFWLCSHTQQFQANSITLLTISHYISESQIYADLQSQLFQTRTIKFLTFLSQNLCQSQINAALFQNEAL